MILFTFLNGQIQNNNSICSIVIIIKPPHHPPLDILTSVKLYTKVLHGKRLDTHFSFY